VSRAASLLAAAASLLAGCGAPAREERPGYLVVALESNPTALDPRYATDANSERIVGLIYSSLTRPDESSQIRPDLAERWERVGPTAYRFHLRRDALFHDGRAVTSADVQYTYESVLARANRSPKRGPLLGLSVRALSPHVVQFDLDRPFAPILNYTNLGIVPAGTGVNPRSLIGAGPFMLEEHVRGDRIVLKAHPDYWEGAPRLAGVVFQYVPDAIVRALEFKKGTLQLIQNDIEPDIVPWLKAETRATISTRQGTTFQYIGVNLEHPILRSRQVRQAIAHAVDREAVLRYLLGGLATPATGLLSPLHWAYEAAVARYPYDPTEAERLLDAAGFSDPDGDGPRMRFTLTYKTTTVDLRRRIAEAFKEQLARVGIGLEVRTHEWGTFYDDIKKGRFHIYSLAWVGVHEPDIYFNLFHSSRFPPSGDNRGRYRNPELDDLLERGRRALDPAERKIIYGQVQKILARDLPYIPLWWTHNVAVLDPRVRGFKPLPDGDLISLKEASLIAGESDESRPR
jgi:peptide/nickel transport system substrate-binding protein